ncbi:MAG: hypothetical protein PVG26_00955 [Desulfobacterales bacterium]
MLVMEAWLHHIRHNFSGVAACIEKIENLNATSQPLAELLTNRELEISNLLKYHGPR